MPPGWRLARHGDRVVADPSGSVAGVASPEPAGALVGRARELTAITTAMTAARRGTARAVHLVGEPGIGKTTLAEHAAVLASEQGWVVAWGRAWDAGGAAPYWLWQQVLGSLARIPSVSGRVHPATVAWLVDWVPELAGATEVPPAPVLDPDRARLALQRAVLHVLGAAVTDRPLLVVLDDVHDADAASLALATLVCRSLPDSRLLVLTTQRPVGPASQATTMGLLGQLNRQGALVPVGPLDQAAVAAQATALAGTQPAAEEVAWLHRASGGNPLFVDQLVRWSATRERAGPPDELPVSAAVREVVGERLDGLGGDARRLVLVAAGEEVDQQVLAAVAGLRPGRFADAVGEAVAAGILWRRLSEQPSCGFVHALLREAARTQVDAEVRRALHVEIAAALEALPGRPGRLAEVAYHYRAALPAGEPQVMVDRTVAAGEAALRVFAHEAAVAQCTAGLTAIGSYGSGGLVRQWRARLLSVLGEARRHAGDLVGARQALVDAHGLAAGAGDPVLAAEAAIRMPRVMRFGVPDRELESMLTGALAGLGDAAPALRARLLARHAVIAEDASDRQARSDQAVEAARRLGDAGLLAEVLSARLYVQWAPETVAERLATSTEIIELAVRTGDVRRELDGRMWRLIALLEFGRVAEAEAELDRYERLAERLDQPEFLFFARSRRATLASLRGRFDDAERLARAAYDLATKAALPDAGNVLSAQLGMVAAARGRNLSDEMPELAVRDVPLVIRAYGLLAVGRREQARALLPAGVGEMDPGWVLGPARSIYLAMVAEVAYQLGDADAARLVREQLIGHADRFIVAAGAVGCAGAVSRSLGLCALTLEQLDEAVGWLRQAVASNRLIGAAPFVACAQAELAVALRRRGRAGDAQEARQLLAESASAAAELGMSVLAREIAGLQSADTGPGPDRPWLRQDGETWLLTMGGRTTRLRPSKGLAQLALLLANPGQEITAVELAGGLPVPWVPDPVLDQTAKRAYRQRLAELDGALDRAAARGDAAGVDGLEVERAALVAELKRAAGLAGRSPGFSDEAERARVNVTRTIRQALDRILVADPQAGRHLLGSGAHRHPLRLPARRLLEHLRSPATNASSVAATTRRCDVRMVFFMDPVSGWSWWTPLLPVEAKPPDERDPTDASACPAGQGLVVGLLGGVGAWLGVCEQTPSGRWRRLHVSRRDPWEPGARRHHRTVWSWWCP
jgi:tetratricopeptide (TPR) repeat protein